MKAMRRREFLKIAGVGSVFLFTCPSGLAQAAGDANSDGSFTFLQLSDTHIGFVNPAVNPESATTLKKAITAINAISTQPDFIVFTGDLSHTTDDPQERRKRLAEFKEIAGGLACRDIHFLPGEHDASLDKGEAYMEFFGKTHYAFEHKGVTFICVDNVSDPSGSVGDVQIKWIEDELKKRSKTDPIVILTHRPLFDLAPDWDWATRDGEKVIDLFMPYQNVTVLYGHIHQLNDHETGHIGHHAARGMMYPLPAPNSVPQKAPIPWDPTAPFKGLGYRKVDEMAGKPAPTLTEFPLNAS
jgi:Icc-related predicted phosphoesterase